MSESPDQIPTFAEISADPEIAALLTFTPVPMRKRVNGWDADAQRAFVALLAMTGSKLRAAKALGRNEAAIERVLSKPGADAFAAAVEGAIALAVKRSGKALARGVAAAHRAEPTVQARGQVLNEHGEWEDEESLRRRGEEASESICGKLLRIRRVYLAEISHCPGKRAAFEILTELPIDWDKAARMEAQPDEPYRNSNQYKPDMILLAESGWSWGEIGYGPDRKREAREALNQYRIENGQEPIDWSDERDSAEHSDEHNHPPRDFSGRGTSEAGGGAAQ